MGQFSGAVSAWVRETKAREEAVFKESVQRVVEIAQTPGPSVANPGGGRGGHMPIDTGFLRASLTAMIGTGDVPAVANPNRDAKRAYDPGPISLVIANADLGDTITLAYTANYAIYVHRKYQWVNLAAQQWPQIVSEVSAEAQRRAGA